MKTLEQCRAELDAVDRQIVRLFEERMSISREVAAYKIANGMAVLDSSREEQVLRSRVEMLRDPCWEGSVRALFEAIMGISRIEQQRLVNAAEEDA